MQKPLLPSPFSSVPRAAVALLIAGAAVLGATRLGSLATSRTASVGPHGSASCAASASACALPASRVPEPSSAPRGGPHLLEFESAHCTVCARMAPLVKELERRCAGDMKTIVRVDVDEPEGEEIAARYGVRFLPTFIRTDGTGEEVRRIVGEQPKESLAGMLSELRGQACPALL